MYVYYISLYSKYLSVASMPAAPAAFVCVCVAPFVHPSHAQSLHKINLQQNTRNAFVK